MGCVYVIKNTRNKKMYVGQTVNSHKERFKKHISMVYSDGCSALYSAMKKYGCNTFYVRVIIKGDFSKSKLNDLEEYYIKKINTMSPHGYNLTTGGSYFKMSEQSKTKMIESMKGRKITWSDKISSSVKKLWENEDYRKKMLSVRGIRGKYKKHKKPLRLNLPINKINTMHLSGMNINQIAKYFKVPFSTIKRRIKNVY